MNLSDRGYNKIRKYEGYGRKTADGGCAAYQEKINGKYDIPTIGYGCTRGVTMGMVWTKEQAEIALRDEIARHEARVTRLVTVELNQNQFDALVSFDFNTGALAKSTALKRLNAGDIKGAVAGLKLYDKFGGKPCKALVARRADEAALFLERFEPAEPNTMPQSADASREPVKALTAAAITTASVTALSPPTAILETATAWRGFSGQVVEFGSWAMAPGNRLSVAVILVIMGGVVWWSKHAENNK